jgi:hypothetical protein
MEWLFVQDVDGEGEFSRVMEVMDPLERKIIGGLMEFNPERR